MRKFTEYIKESSQFVLLDNGRGGNLIKTSKYGSRNSISYINNIIKNYIDKVYGPFGFVYGKNDIDLNVNGQIINTEYISKMVNNYTVFKSIIRNFNIKDEDSLYNVIENNIDDIYGYKGSFFRKETLPILINTTRKGNVLEKLAKESFLSYANSKNIDITIQNPTIDEDVNGIDFKFTHNSNTYTVQVKPFTEYKYVEDNIQIKSNGSLSIDTNYLILCDGTNCIKLKNTKKNPILISGDIFISKRSNILI